MGRRLRGLLRWFAVAWARRHYWLHRWSWRTELPLAGRARGVPESATVYRIPDAPVTVIDDFLSFEEVDEILNWVESQNDTAGALPGVPYEEPIGQFQLMPITISPALGGNYRYLQNISMSGRGIAGAHQQTAKILSRVAGFLGCQPSQAESLGLIRYAEGDHYKQHWDAYAGHQFDFDRRYTVVIYLSDGETGEGGRTLFDYLKIAITPRRGRAVVWENKDQDGRQNILTSHGSERVSGAAKWSLVSYWRNYRMMPADLHITDQRVVPIRYSVEAPEGVGVYSGPFEFYGDR